MLNYIKLWLPGAANILLLSIELPLIAFLLIGKPDGIVNNYTISIAYLMFANALIYPITPFVVKNGNNRYSLKWSTFILVSVLAVFNGYIFFYIQNVQVREVAHLFSISLLFIGVKRYLQACLILNKYTLPISQSAFVRIIITCLVSIYFTHQDMINRYDVLVVMAILLGGFSEVSILAYAIFKQKILLLDHKYKNCIYKGNFISYISLILLSASYLATNLLLMRFFEEEPWISQYWTIIFTLTSISIYPLLDVESIFIKIKRDDEISLFYFSFIISMITSLFAMTVLFILARFLNEESIVSFIYTPSVFFSFLITPFLWSMRSAIRINYILDNKNQITILAIILSFIVSLYLGKLMTVSSPVMLFNMIIWIEILIYLFYSYFYQIKYR